MSTYPEEISIHFMSYANISFKAEIYAEELNIEWGDGGISVYRHPDFTTISHDFFCEGLINIQITGKNISYLNVSRLSLTSLSLSYCSQLEYLDCSVNELTELDLTTCPNLEELYCNSNNLIQLNLPAHPKLLQINVSYNILKQLDITNCESLQYIYCSNNHLDTFLFNKNIPLHYLDIGNNLFTDKELNQIFQQLSFQNEKDRIYYGQNPDSEFCNIQLLKEKGK